MNIAIKTSGGNVNPESNRALKKLIDEALAQHVPKSTVDKVLKAYKTSAEDSKEFLFEIRGPGRAGVLVECLAKKKGHLEARLNPIMRKCGASQEIGVANMFERKGLILADMRAGTTFDDAESDAIESGAEEVAEIDEQTLEFVTDQNDLAAVSQQLTEVGYKCRDASITFISNTEVELNVIEQKTLQKMVDLLMEEECVTAVHSNAV